MRVVKGEYVRAHVYVLVGDGGRDVRILTAVAERYNHGKVLRVPRTPTTAGTGLDSVIRALAKLLDARVVIDKYLILIDREHVKSLKDVKGKFTSYGFEVLSVEDLNEASWVLKVRRGAKVIKVYVAVLGLSKRVEENLAKLIKLTYGDDVEGSKESVNKWLKEHGMKNSELVSKASRQQIEKALPTLTQTLKKLAKDP